jgi:hypothetical protein
MRFRQEPVNGYRICREAGIKLGQRIGEVGPQVIPAHSSVA